jgi:hypothetical protein
MASSSKLTPSAAHEGASLAARLVPGKPNPTLSPLITDCACTEPVRAGLYLINGDWDAAHKVAQDVETPLGAHWHALVHRHEPDFPNSKYWLSQTGQSPIYPALAEAARAAGRDEVLRSGKWDAGRFTDCFADPEKRTWTRALDELELRLLLEHCLVQERGG